MSPINLDADPGDADWIKTLSWDVPRDAETFIRTELEDGAPEQQRASLADFLRLSAARPMPAELGTELSWRGCYDGEG
jgi:hypothetical protein